MAISFESLITRLSTHFIRLGPEETYAGIELALRELGEAANVDRTYVFRFGPTTATNTHEWCAQGITSHIQDFQQVPYQAFPWWVEQIQTSNVVNIERLEELPPEAELERQVLAAQGVRSLIVVPLVREQEVVGFVGFDSVRAHKRWSESEIALLRLVGEMLVNALSRQEAELERRRLEAQLADARRLDAVARLAGGVAHDFNNALTVIGNLAMLLEGAVSEPEHQIWARQICESSERAAELTRQLLRIGRRDLVTDQVIDVNRVISRLAPLLRKTLREDLSLELDLEHGLPCVRLSEGQLEQVLVNLALNARDAMSAGGKLVLSTRAASDHVVLEAADDGSGMSEEVAARAFEPFFTTKGDTGTGLGLSTVHGIVSQANGWVRIQSTPGSGTTIVLGLPATSASESRRPSDVPTTRNRIAGHTVLVVEDFEQVRSVVVAMLASAGYRVLSASSCDEALALVRNLPDRIDLLLTDVVMPGRSGVELARELRELRPSLRVLLMSGHAQEIASADLPILAKPFDAQALATAVRGAIA